MKNASLFSLILLLSTLAVSSSVFAEQTEEDYDKLCRSYAQEDNVAADELDAYVKDCIEGLKAENATPEKGQE